MDELKIEQPIATKIVKIIEEAKDIRTFVFEYKIKAKPGQFVLLWLPGEDLKPFGVSSLGGNRFTVTVCKVGKFTKKLFEKKIGDYVGIQGPYGNGFSLGKKKAVLVAGGYGSAPLAFLADELIKEGTQVTLVIGAKNKECLIYGSRFSKDSVNLICTTDDGSSGRKGFTTEVLQELLQRDPTIDMVYTCGPEIMMQKVMELSDQYGVDCEISMERYMKCGFGICGQCCVDGAGIRLCQEGPVFSKQFVKEHISEFNQHKREASGKVVFFRPPVKRIDPHVHFRDEEQKYKETIAHGLKVAKSQGVNYVFDMPNTHRLVLREADVKRRLALVPLREKGRYFTYVGATSDQDQLKEAISLVNKYPEVVGLKMFAGKSTGDLQVLAEEKQKKVYSVLAQNNYLGVLVVHCEKEAEMKKLFDPKDPHTHVLSRPSVAEIESVRDQIRFVKETRFLGTLHICHISCPEAVKLVDEDRSQIKITCGVTPHHLLWDENKMKDPEHGLLYKMNPPLRTRNAVLALRECLKFGKIDWIETDHAPHSLGEKLNFGYYSGYPSLNLYQELVEKNLPKWGISKEQIDNLTYHNIVKAFNLNLR